MRIFRGERLIDRDKEIEFVKSWFDNIPKEILWIYGPKSSGKTTLIEYIVENELFEDFEDMKPKDRYWVRYINLRRKLVTSYDTFLESFIKPKEEYEELKKEERLSAKVSVGIFSVRSEKLKKIKEKKFDLFDVLVEELSKISKHKMPILIIDEVQTVEDIYINSERELLKEFLNFCVALTKELHLAHVVILSSNTVFIDRIYNDAKLKVTSEFYKIDHLDKQTTEEWLREEGFTGAEIDVIWDYLGGCIPLIQKMIKDKDRFSTLREYLEYRKDLAFSEIIDFIQRGDFTKEEKEMFKDICRRILAKGCYLLTDEDKDKEIKIVDRWAEKEILFFDPLTREVRGNNRLYEKGMEKLLGIG